MLNWALVTPAGLGHPEGISHWEKTIPYFLFLLKGGGGGNYECSTSHFWESTSPLNKTKTDAKQAFIKSMTSINSVDFFVEKRESKWIYF